MQIKRSSGSIGEIISSYVRIRKTLLILMRDGYGSVEKIFKL